MKPVYVLGAAGDPGQALWLRREVGEYATLGIRDLDGEAAIVLSTKDISAAIAALTDLQKELTRFRR